MKTILVIYTSIKISNPGYTQRYAFNTESDLKVGDMIKSPKYSTNMQVVKELPKAYKYFNKSTGRLSDKFNNSNQFEIKELVIREESEAVVYASKIEE